jgi:hypothetical protein
MREMAQLPTRALRRSITGTSKEDRMSKFKLRHAKLLMSMTTLVALVVTSGAGFKF